MEVNLKIPRPILHNYLKNRFPTKEINNFSSLKPSMHNVSKKKHTYFSNLAANAARFLNCGLPFQSFVHYRVKSEFICSIQQQSLRKIL